MKNRSLNVVGVVLVIAIAVGATWVWAQASGTPILRVLIYHSVILGEYWPGGATVTLTIDDPITGPGVDYTESVAVPPDGEVVFDMRASFQLQPGQLVTLSDGLITRELTITSLQVTSVDPDKDKISGTADPGAEVSVEVETEDELAFRYPTANAAGSWSADFSVPGGGPGQGVLDIGCSGVDWRVDRFDEDGDSTRFRFDYGPRFQVRLPSGVWSSGWMVDSTVTLTIDDDNDPGNGVLYTISQTTEPSPWGMWFDQHANWAFFGTPVDIQPGYVVRTNDDFCSTDHTVKDLSVTNIDLKADTVAGLADPNVSLHLHIYKETTAKRWAQADDSGHWFADFSDPQGGDTHDITLETEGLVGQRDEDDGNDTVVSWYVSSFIVSSVSQCIDDVQDLVDGGTLKPGQANGLIRPLENALRSLEEGKANAVCSQLQDFVDKVNDKINNGVLSLEEGQALIDAATDIRDVIGCNP
jgi:hypothetical protein